jgi:hypothetical protein
MRSGAILVFSAGVMRMLEGGGELTAENRPVASSSDG